MKHAVVVLPTYNEKDNIELILREIVVQRAALSNIELSVLVVDDNSPDGTSEIVKAVMQREQGIQLLNGKKEGLGKAYIRGFAYALEKMNADIVIEMDADFSHDPRVLPALIGKVIEGYDFVIGSRYIKGGGIPENWPLLRKLNSRIGNILARYVAGISGVNDCTGGYRAISRNILEKIDLNRLNVAGYAFQINLLHRCVREGAKVAEVPIQFIDRKYGKSKIRIDDIVEFVIATFKLRLSTIRTRYFFIVFFFVAFVLSYSLFSFFLNPSSYTNFTIGFVFVLLFLSIAMTIQGLLTLVWMFYAWHDGDRAILNKSPEKFFPAQVSFSALVPARHEEQVIFDTIKAVSSIDYPEEKKETLVIVRFDDVGTIDEARRAIDAFPEKNIRLIVIDGFPINKPKGLNIGFREAQNDVVAVFDAEDEPHRDIFNIINTVMVRDNADVVQSGVQLMNYHSNWFSTFNVLEYFFWFKSALHFFASKGLIPLGGNTVFFKRLWLEKVNGWDENCLTEDADIGIRMSLAGAKIRVVYDENHVTQEETPDSLQSFISQRTRWNQGFIQIFMKGDWKKLPTLTQRLLAVYVLIVPELQTLLFLYAPLTLFTMLVIKLPVVIALMTFVPFYILVLQLITYNIGLIQFTRDYKKKYTAWMLIKTVITFYPFQLILGLSALRAISRNLQNNLTWEKTKHTNAHREVVPAAVEVLAVE